MKHNVGIAHHKHPSRCGSCVAVWHQRTHGLVVMGAFAVVEGVIVQGVHQVGVNLTEKHTDLHGRREETRSASSSLLEHNLSTDTYKTFN